jgi:hypothetical protein
MESQFNDIEADIRNALDKLDNAIQGASREQGFIIERGMGKLDEWLRYDFDEIEKAFK